MELTIDYILDEWKQVNKDITGSCILQSIINFCASVESSEWKLLFTEDAFMKKVTDNFFSIGGTVLNSRKRKPENRTKTFEEFSATRICNILRLSSCLEHQLIVAIMAKIYKCLYPIGPKIKYVLGSHAAQCYKTVKNRKEIWKQPLSLSNLLTKCSAEVKIKFGQVYLKEAIRYLKLADECLNLNNEMKGFIESLNALIK